MIRLQLWLSIERHELISINAPPTEIPVGGYDIYGYMVYNVRVR